MINILRIIFKTITKKSLVQITPRSLFHVHFVYTEHSIFIVCKIKMWLKKNNKHCDSILLKGLGTEVAANDLNINVNMNTHLSSNNTNPS